MEGKENEDVKTRREMALSRLQEKYPDKDFSDEEVLFGQIYDDYDDYDNQIKGYKEREDALVDMFSKDERSAQFLMDWKNGEHPITALIRRLGIDGLRELVENEDKREEFGKANEEYLARLAKSKELDAEWDRNLSESLAMLDKKQADEGLSDEQVSAAMNLLLTIAHDAIVGKFTSESVDMALKAINHDVDVTEAAEEAEIRGRNAKIDETLRKKGGDGTAALAGKNGSAGSRKAPSMGALDRYGDGIQDIWERGAEKRTRN
ncbi:MAG: hypothetical protein IJM84_06725 [Bacteroidaceae bacterium]|nr:hypothetical protein [Bacteroidaceae bacterium]